MSLFGIFLPQNMQQKTGEVRSWFGKVESKWSCYFRVSPDPKLISSRNQP